MKKVITYGTYDLLHEGHINLLKRAKELGDYLIVGVTSSDFDRHRGKITVQQTLAERMQAVKDTGYADEVIPEEYFGQKIDDIRHYGIDIFTVGSDWEGHFDYLREYCEVIYLDRTQGISSTVIRSETNRLRLGIVGNTPEVKKFIDETKYVSGIEISGICPFDEGGADFSCDDTLLVEAYADLLHSSDAIYVACSPRNHYRMSKDALLAGKHVLCESPLAFSAEQANELFHIAKKKNVILFEALKTAYALAFSRMMLLVKSEHIGKVRTVRATCTSLAKKQGSRSSFFGWGPIALLPVFSSLGVHYRKTNFTTCMDREDGTDSFTQLELLFDEAIASIVVGNGIKSEGDLVVSGTKGYIYVPSPWWKTDYFEIRYEDFSRNKRYFYQLDGEGIRFELAAFSRAIRVGSTVDSNIPQSISVATAGLMGEFANGTTSVDYLS